MPRKAQKEALPPVELHGAPIRVVGLKVEELPHLTFYGKDWEDLRRNVKSELFRLYKDRYSLVVPDNLVQVFDKE